MRQNPFEQDRTNVNTTQSEIDVRASSIELPQSQIFNGQYNAENQLYNQDENHSFFNLRSDETGGEQDYNQYRDSFGMRETGKQKLSTIIESSEIPLNSFTSSKAYEEFININGGLPNHLIQNQVFNLHQLNAIQLDNPLHAPKVARERQLESNDSGALAANLRGRHNLLKNQKASKGASLQVIAHSSRAYKHLGDSSNVLPSSYGTIKNDQSPAIPSRLVRGGGTPFNPYQANSNNFVTPFKPVDNFDYIDQVHNQVNLTRSVQDVNSKSSDRYTQKSSLFPQLSKQQMSREMLIDSKIEKPLPAQGSSRRAGHANTNDEF